MPHGCNMYGLYHCDEILPRLLTITCNSECIMIRVIPCMQPNHPCFPYNSIYGTTWFHAIPNLEPYTSIGTSYGSIEIVHGFIRFYAEKRRHETIVWNHIIPCMELHGIPMNVDAGWVNLDLWDFACQN